MQSRLIVKQLRKKALKEYKEKRPTEIFGYRVKKSVVLHRGFGPSIIVSGLKGRIVPYLLLANYGDHYRLYYILENGVTLSAINILTSEFERERLKFQKATTQLFQIPKPPVSEKRIEKIKKQINEKFQYYIAQIEKQTSCKVKTLPIITVYQSSEETKVIIKRERNFIKFPVELISHKLIDGFLAREAYKLVFPTFIRKTKQAKLFEIMGAYLFLTKLLKKDWLQYWEPKEPFKAKLTKIGEAKFYLLLQFLCYLGKYESTLFLDSQIGKIISIFPELAQKTDKMPDIAAQCYLQLANHEGYFIIKAAFFFILANRFKEAKKALKELSKFTQSDQIRSLRVQCEHLVSLQLAKFYSSGLDLNLFASDIQELYTVTLEHVKIQVLEVKRIHKQRVSTSESITIELKIKNLTDLTFLNIKLTDNPPKKSQLELLSSNTFHFTQLSPNEKITCEYQVSCKTPQKIWFKNGHLSFEDNYNNH
ncbi:MAG: hypothetical protein HWN66_14090, partial [Candidatus Helarchaeota archaeon]|nr:hypothetical protein [Candidatus Helarchaeota archaeon]